MSIEVLRDKYEQAEKVIKEADMPFLGVADFLKKQIERAYACDFGWVVIGCDCCG